MNQSELISEISRRTGWKKSQVIDLLGHLFEAVHDALAAGEDVTLPHIAKISVKRREAREGRNPATGETIDIPAKWVPHASFAKSLKDRIAGLRND